MRRTFVWIARVLLAAVALVAIGLGALWARSERALRRSYAPSPAELALEAPAPDSAAVARGRHLATAIGTCTLCHGEDLGGALYADAGPLGVIAGPNLTRSRGGRAAPRTTADWVRAIRFGVRDDGTSLVVMPSEVYTHLSDRDLAALVAYLDGLPPVDRESPRTRFGPVGRLMLGAGRLNLLVAPKTRRLTERTEPAPGPTAEYGRYLADVAGCHGCHGYGLSGGRVAGPPGLPPASNLTPAGRLPSWSEGDFVRAMRTGTRPDGTRIDEFMPWRQLGRMTDEELRAIWLYLRSVPARPFGNK